MAYTMIDFFAGIGGFTLGFESAGFECIGHCEVDRHACKSYDAIHGVREGAWFASDITAVRPVDVPPCDCFTAGFPCQDISVSGRGAGLLGARSSLFFEIIRIIQGKNPNDRPLWVVLENVKNLLSINRGRDFAAVLYSLAESGYDVEYEVLNSKNFGIPQNRERVFVVGHFGGERTGKIFPILGTNSKDIIRLVNGRQGRRVYDPTGIGITLTAQGGGQGGQTGLYAIGVNSINGAAEIGAADYSLNPSGCQETGCTQNAVFVDLCNSEARVTDTARCLMGKYTSGITNHPGINSGVLVRVKEATKQGYAEAGEGDSINLSVPGSLTRRGRVGKGIANTLDTSCNQGVLDNCRIRRLTPREAWRLQGVRDELFDRAAYVCSDAQLYKQAGNGVTVNVVYHIARKLLANVNGGCDDE